MSIESGMPSNHLILCCSFSSCPQSFPASGSFQMSQLFALGGQSIGVSTSASVLPMNTQDWSLLGWTGLISLRSKGLSRVFSNTTVQKLWVVNAHYYHLNLQLYQKPLSQQTRKRTKWHLNWKGRSKNDHHLQITIYIYIYTWGFPGGSVVMNPPERRRCGLIPESGRCPEGGNGSPFQYSYLVNTLDRGLAGYSPWGHKSQT